MVLNNKAIKELVKSKDINVGTDYLEHLEVEVVNLISSSISRAKSNSRKTVYGRDL